jgi:hypothetical protein
MSIIINTYNIVDDNNKIIIIRSDTSSISIKMTTSLTNLAAAAAAAAAALNSTKDTGDNSYCSHSSCNKLPTTIAAVYQLQKRHQ